jgi:hypothetical protein
MVQSVQRLATGWTTEEFEFDSRQGQHFPLLQVVQTATGADPMDTRGFAQGIKPERKVVHSQLVTRSTKCGSTYPLPHTSSWRSPNNEFMIFSLCLDFNVFKRATPFLFHSYVENRTSRHARLCVCVCVCVDFAPYHFTVKLPKMTSSYGFSRTIRSVNLKTCVFCAVAYPMQEFIRIVTEHSSSSWTRWRCTHSAFRRFKLHVSHFAATKWTGLCHGWGFHDE